MRRASLILLMPSTLLLLAASNCEGASSVSTVPVFPEQPIYESGDPGSLAVTGENIEARARFTLGADDSPWR